MAYEDTGHDRYNSRAVSWLDFPTSYLLADETNQLTDFSRLVGWRCFAPPVAGTPPFAQWGRKKLVVETLHHAVHH